LEGALAGHGDDSQLAQSAEVLQERAVGQSGSKSPVIFLEQTPGDVTAQGAPAVALAGGLGFGTNPLALAGPALQVFFHELSLQAAGVEQLVDAQKLVTQLSVIDIALDGGQSGGQW
jgi:hypothetical protein